MDIQKHQKTLNIIIYLQKYIADLGDTYGHNKNQYAKSLLLLQKAFTILHETLNLKEAKSDYILQEIENKLIDLEKRHIN